MCNREMATPALDFTGTIAGKKKQPVVLDRSFCEVVQQEGGMATTDRSNLTSCLLLEHVDRVFVFHFQL